MTPPELPTRLKFRQIAIDTVYELAPIQPRPRETFGVLTPSSISCGLERFGGGRKVQVQECSTVFRPNRGERWRYLHLRLV
jgi:hypothetical protein